MGKRKFIEFVKNVRLYNKYKKNSQYIVAIERMKERNWKQEI